MASQKINRIMLAGTGSGCGKTTLTCGILKALINKGLSVASFKTGPDYIDPMFHSTIIGAKSRNLDLFLCGEQTTRYLFAKNSADCDISVVEGVMGFYDGLGMDEIEFSSCDLSNKTDTPVILVVNIAGMSLSASALIQGFLNFQPNHIRGVILNNASAAMFPLYKKSIESHAGIPVLGYLPKLPEVAIESRHLGLVTAAEIDTLAQKVELLADAVAQTIDMDALWAIASSAPPLAFQTPAVGKCRSVRIAIAQDKAFCFYYQDSLDLLTQMGAELVSFSPLHDSSLPNDIAGLILGGGYPELYADRLSANTSMLNSIRAAIASKMPTYAECGGFMYLGNTIRDKSGTAFPMVGAIDIDSQMTSRLQNFGYMHLVAQKDTLLCGKGEHINAHEFHYAKSSDDGDAFLETKVSSGKMSRTISAIDNLFGGYPHLHFWGNPRFARNMIDQCRQFKERRF